VRNLNEIGNNTNGWSDYLAVEDTSFTLIERKKYYAYLGLKLVLLHSESYEDMVDKTNLVCNGLKRINAKDDHKQCKAKRNNWYVNR
jgi:hypothetical protein